MAVAVAVEGMVDTAAEEEVEEEGEDGAATTAAAAVVVEVEAAAAAAALSARTEAVVATPVGCTAEEVARRGPAPEAPAFRDPLAAEVGPLLLLPRCPLPDWRC